MGLEVVCNFEQNIMAVLSRVNLQLEIDLYNFETLVCRRKMLLAFIFFSSLTQYVTFFYFGPLFLHDIVWSAFSSGVCNSQVLLCLQNVVHLL